MDAAAADAHPQHNAPKGPRRNLRQSVLYLLGLGEESIYECGTSAYTSPLTLTVTRTVAATLNLGVLAWLLTTGTPPALALFWVVPVPWAALSIEAWALALTCVGGMLMALCATKAAAAPTAAARDHAHLAHVAGPVALAGAVLSIFALAATPVGRPPAIRIMVHLAPIGAALADLALGSRNRFRMRTAAVPLTLAQIQQAIATFYLWLFQRSTLLAQATGFRFFAITVLYNLLTLVCAVAFVTFARITLLCDRAPPMSPVSPQKMSF